MQPTISQTTHWIKKKTFQYLTDNFQRPLQQGIVCTVKKIARSLYIYGRDLKNCTIVSA